MEPDIKPSWKNRRKFMLATSAFCAVVISYIIIFGKDTTVNETAITMSFLTLMGIIGSYVFGATWQDISLNKKEGKIDYGS
jgi:hypothetical protein